MPRSAAPALADRLAGFDRELETLAWDIVHAVLRDELARRRAAAPRRRTAAASSAAPAAPDAPAPELAPSPAAPRGRRASWTRERVVEELAQWIIEVKTPDASFLVRRGQAPLVAAARRIFGRFDAALNVATLHLATLYPEGIPKRGDASG